jgi:hypothetical protein
MSYTVLDLAKLALAVYDDPLPAVDGWTPRKNFGSTVKHGFYAGLYQGTRDNSIFVLAYRGTDDWQVDLVDDATILLGWISAQMAHARKASSTCKAMVADASNRKLCLTGHSLGGGLAALIASQFDVPCVTFNAPGTKRSLTAHYIKNVSGGPFFAPMIKLTAPHEVKDGRILNIRARFDLVSVGTGPSVGVTDSINVQCEAPTASPSQVQSKPESPGSSTASRARRPTSFQPPGS